MAKSVAWPAGARRAIDSVAAVKCSECGALHDADSDEFITVYGNLTIGVKTEVIGGNLDDKGKLTQVKIFCRDGCALKNLKSLFPADIKILNRGVGDGG